jgi:hypothetical protein
LKGGLAWKLKNCITIHSLKQNKIFSSVNLGLYYGLENTMMVTSKKLQEAFSIPEMKDQYQRKK